MHMHFNIPTPSIVSAGLLIFSIWTSFLAATPCQAAWDDLVDDRYVSAKPVTATPFDSKLSEADFFQESIMTQNEAAPSSEQLFRIARSFRYQDDLGRDNWQSADETSSKKRGDCEDKAIWLYKKLRESGYKNVCLTVGNYRPNGPRFHVWVTYLDEGGNIRLLDPVIQAKSWKVEDLPQSLYRPLFAFNGKNRYRF